MNTNDKQNSDKIVLVTGASRGIGLETTRQLARRGAQVILTARDAASGNKAVAALAKDGLTVGFHQLEVTNPKSIAALKDYLAAQHGRLDVLVNNAGINVDGGATPLTVSADQVRTTFETNTIAPLLVAQALVPLLKKSSNGRIVNVSSSMASSHNIATYYPAYCISKFALNSVTLLLAAELKNSSVVINSMCPGWVRTDLGGPNAPRSVEEGADTAVWLALDAPADLTGKFVHERQVINW